jgi:hypothetical protein
MKPKTYNGYPALHDDLSLICPERSSLSKLFVMGSYAGLVLGPGALNLLGSRNGAYRIAKSVRKVESHAE